MTCDQCFHEIYEPSFNAGQNINCRNPSCRAYLNVKNCDSCKFIFVDSRGRNRCEPCYEEEKKNKGSNHSPLESIKKKSPPETNKQTEVSRPTTTTTSSKGIAENLQCKICFDNEADYINTKCFHMSVCELCVKSMKNQCPICRATGEFRKVFK